MKNELGKLSDSDLLRYYHLYKEGMDTTTRFESVKQNGVDVKSLYHVVRLLDEVEQILALGDIDLQRNKEQLKAIRRGDMSEEDIRKWASDKEAQLEKLYIDSKLPYKPDENQIKDLLLSCLEEHYGSLDECINWTESDKIDIVMQDLKKVLEKWESK